MSRSRRIHNGGPIGTMAGIHLNAALPNSYVQEVPVPASDRDAAMRAEMTSGNKEVAEKGFAALINRPGLGFEVNERALEPTARSAYETPEIFWQRWPRRER